MRVERGQLGAQSTVYILVHLQVSVRREVVDLVETRQVDVDAGVPGELPYDLQRCGRGGLVGTAPRSLGLHFGRRLHRLGHHVVHAPDATANPWGTVDG
ncbi:hypothetical protein SVEN_1421, partial [Streptomyces venezuelae ATCC 10712]